MPGWMLNQSYEDFDMEIRLGPGDVTCLLLDSGEGIAGTIEATEAGSVIIKTGPGAHEVEAVARTSIVRAILYEDSFESALSKLEFGMIDFNSLIDERDPDILLALHAPPALPVSSGKVPPAWSEILEVWMHKSGGVCTCGCLGGEISKSETSVISPH